jgi:hypothetical protein
MKTFTKHAQVTAIALALATVCTAASAQGKGNINPALVDGVDPMSQAGIQSFAEAGANPDKQTDAQVFDASVLPAMSQTWAQLNAQNRKAPTSAQQYAAGQSGELAARANAGRSGN